MRRRFSAIREKPEGWAYFAPPPVRVLNKNVNHSNDTIDNLNQSSFHKPARHCQGQLRTESFPASAHILHCGVRYGLGWCGPASALKIVRQLIFDNHVTFV